MTGQRSLVVLDVEETTIDRRSTSTARIGPWTALVDVQGSVSLSELPQGGLEALESSPAIDVPPARQRAQNRPLDGPGRAPWLTRGARGDRGIEQTFDNPVGLPLDPPEVDHQPDDDEPEEEPEDEP